LVLGIGIGDNELEFAEQGIPFAPTRERQAALEETIHTVVAMSVPLARRLVATVCRRSWTRVSGGSPARATMALKNRITLRARRGAPVRVAKSRPWSW
jgi:hypothetical protein